jgi:hypothetical protein
MSKLVKEKTIKEVIRTPSDGKPIKEGLVYPPPAPPPPPPPKKKS